jgi:hypothetical protein
MQSPILGNLGKNLSYGNLEKPKKKPKTIIWKPLGKTTKIVRKTRRKTPFL